MNSLFIPQPDTIPVSWGWFHFLLLLTFPLHLLAMNSMLGGLVLGIVQQLRGGEVRRQLAHRIGLALPLIIALTVNLGVAPFLFLQVLYGQFNYTSSILMGLFWIMVIPLLIVAYGAAYFYDFKFNQLGRAGVVIGIMVAAIFLVIGFFFTNNMLLMLLVERFGGYFNHMSGTILATGDSAFWPRYVHNILGALAVGGLYVALLGRFQSLRNPELAAHAQEFGMSMFVRFTLINIVAGGFYLVSLPRERMLLFMGGNMAASGVFVIGLILSGLLLYFGIKRKLWLTVTHLVLLVFLMVFMRSWLRSDYLKQYFTLDQLTMVPQYSPMLLFLATLVLGIVCLFWLYRKTATALASS